MSAPTKADLIARIAALERSEASALAALDSITATRALHGLRVIGTLPYDGSAFSVLVIDDAVNRLEDAAKYAGIFTHAFELCRYVMVLGAGAMNADTATDGAA